MRTINIRGLELIKAFEKCKLKSYLFCDCKLMYVIAFAPFPRSKAVFIEDHFPFKWKSLLARLL